MGARKKSLRCKAYILLNWGKGSGISSEAFTILGLENRAYLEAARLGNPGKMIIKTKRQVGISCMYDINIYMLIIAEFLPSIGNPHPSLCFSTEESIRGIKPVSPLEAGGAQGENTRGRGAQTPCSAAGAASSAGSQEALSYR